MGSKESAIRMLLYKMRHRNQNRRMGNLQYRYGFSSISSICLMLIFVVDAPCNSLPMNTKFMFKIEAKITFFIIFIKYLFSIYMYK
jgi:hypothetical protein